MGKPMQKVYEYTTEGVLIRKYESLSEFRKEHYPDDLGVRPIFKNKVEGYDFHLTKRQTIVLKDRPYRELICFIYKVYTSKFCNLKKSKETDRPIQMFNLKNELLAEFANIKIAALLLSPNISNGTIYEHLKTRKGKYTYALVNDYYFQYKPLKQ
jgi:hypothetical protein